jgi:hypothetical protein
MKKIPKEPEPHHDVDVTVDQFWALVDAMPEHAQPGIVTLAATGMRLNTEYSRAARHVKRESCRRVLPGIEERRRVGHHPDRGSLWPWVDRGIPAPVKERWLRIYFHRAAVEDGLGE